MSLPTPSMLLCTALVVVMVVVVVVRQPKLLVSVE